MLKQIDPIEVRAEVLRTASVREGMVCDYPAPLPGISEPQTVSHGAAFTVSPGTCALILHRSILESLVAEPGTYIIDTHTPGECRPGSLPDTVNASFEKNAAAFRDYACDDSRELIYLDLKPFSFPWSGTTPCMLRVKEPAIQLDMTVLASVQAMCLLHISDPAEFQLMLCRERNTVSVEDVARTVSDFVSMAVNRALQQCPVGSDIVIDTADAKRICNQALKQIDLSDLALFGLSADLIRVTELQPGDGDLVMIRKMREFGLARGLLRENAHPQELCNDRSSVPQASLIPEGKAPAVPQSPKKTWTCTCGASNNGNFCTECGSRKPELPAGPWTCTCGNINQGRFCTECGTPYL